MPASNQATLATSPANVEAAINLFNSFQTAADSRPEDTQGAPLGLSLLFGPHCHPSVCMSMHYNPGAVGSKEAWKGYAKGGEGGVL